MSKYFQGSFTQKENLGNLSHEELYYEIYKYHKINIGLLHRSNSFLASLAQGRIQPTEDDLINEAENSFLFIDSLNEYRVKLEVEIAKRLGLTHEQKNCIEKKVIQEEDQF